MLVSWTGGIEFTGWSLNSVGLQKFAFTGRLVLYENVFLVQTVIGFQFRAEHACE